MRTYCKHLIINEGLVTTAFTQWAKSGAGRKNSHRVEEEHGSAQTLIREITHEIRDQALTLRPIRHYRHIEPTNGKTRIIGVQSVKQQVLDYVAVLAMEPFLTARLGFYQVASVRGKGQTFAARTIRRWSQQGGYWVHLDVRQCYPSIDHEVVMGVLDRYIRSDDVIYVARTLLETYRTGLDIGSYFSLRMAQLILSFGYHHVESLGKVRRGQRRSLVSHQLWYMDDVLLMGPSKRDLKMAIRSLERHMRDEFGLSIKPWKVARVGEDEPIDMAGFVVRPSRTTIRPSIFLRAMRAHRQYDRHPTPALAARACAYWGWLSNSDSCGVVARNDLPRIQKAARITMSEQGCAA